MKKSKILYFLLFMLNLFLHDLSFSQNLVPNYSFEVYDTCPNNLNNLNYALPWNVSGGSPDYYNSCTTSQSSDVPNNMGGWQFARTGNAYVGIGVNGYSLALNLREYIQVQLDSTLIENHKYCVEFYVSLADVMNLATNNIGMYLSNVPPPPPPPLQPYVNCIPQINTTSAITDTANWVLVSGTYVAHGGEQYITIGNFYTDAQTDTVRVANQNGGDGSYYYIDDVSIVDCSGIGINELTDINTLTISPNPANSEIKITTNDNLKLGEVKIYNSIGACVLLSPPLRGGKEGLLDISSLPQGLYFIEVITHKGIQRKKFVKQ